MKCVNNKLVRQPCSMEVYSMPHPRPSSDDSLWQELYAVLYSYVWLLVTRIHLQCCLDQYDTVQDIVQETVVRVYLYMRQAENDRRQPIISLHSFSRWVAHNFCEDLRRKEVHLLRPSLDDNRLDIGDITATRGCWSDPIEEVLEKMALLSFFFELAFIIKTLPLKRRTALL